MSHTSSRVRSLVTSSESTGISTLLYCCLLPDRVKKTKLTTVDNTTTKVSRHAVLNSTDLVGSGHLLTHIIFLLVVLCGCFLVPHNVGGEQLNSDSSATPDKASNLKKVPTPLPNDQLKDSSTECTSKGVVCNLHPNLIEGNLSLELSVRSDNGQEQQQDNDEETAREWTTARSNRVHHLQTPRPKFKLGSTGNHGRAYLTITPL
ncbi:hypothetical protein E2C01_073969 [Portunus trituberculatus]|uniref:Uncharacterized protein n=1 Tax=Portunus trituberculatus TaxID=210409 RepID=A0A5B7I256_PORTR|nr:hypothetical protein [Portunus trituberculatus]